MKRMLPTHLELARKGIRRRGAHRSDCTAIADKLPQPFTWVKGEEELSSRGTRLTSSRRGPRHLWFVIGCDDEAIECGAEILVREDTLIALVVRHA